MCIELRQQMHWCFSKHLVELIELCYQGHQNLELYTFQGAKMPLDAYVVHVYTTESNKCTGALEST